MKIVSAIVSTVFAFSGVLLLGQSDPGTGVSVLTVRGQGEVRAAPDEATVRLGVSRQAERAREAQEQVNLVVQEIGSSLQRIGVKPEQIQTSELRLFPIYSQQRPGSNAEPRVVAYRASNSISVRVNDLGSIGPVIDASLEAGSNQLEDVRFGLRQDLPFKTQALVRAVMEASVKAQAMAEALGVKLIRILEVQEGGSSIPIRPVRMEGLRASQVSEMGASTPIAPGELTVTSSATIRYQIEPR